MTYALRIENCDSNYLTSHTLRETIFAISFVVLNPPKRDALYRCTLSKQNVNRGHHHMNNIFVAIFLRMKSKMIRKI